MSLSNRVCRVEGGLDRGQAGSNPAAIHVRRKERSRIVPAVTNVSVLEELRRRRGPAMGRQPHSEARTMPCGSCAAASSDSPLPFQNWADRKTSTTRASRFHVGGLRIAAGSITRKVSLGLRVVSDRRRLPQMLSTHSREAQRNRPQHRATHVRSDMGCGRAGQRTRSPLAGSRIVAQPYVRLPRSAILARAPGWYTATSFASPYESATSSVRR